MMNSPISFDTILIVGCGYTGTRLAAIAQADGIHVVATRREWDESPEFETLDLDVTDPQDRWAQILGPDTLVVWSVPTFPKLTDHLEPLRNAVAAASDANVAGFIYISSTSVFGDHGGERVSDESPCHPDAPAGRMRLESEKIVRDRGGMVVRPAGIYGPGRDIATSIQSGRYEVIDPQKITNRIHVNDLARAILFVARNGAAGEAFNAADGKATTVGEVVEFLVDEYGIPRPKTATLEDYAQRRGVDAAARWKNQHWVAPDLLGKRGFVFEYPDIFAAYRTGGIR
jgi:nucleoside-diphosphate-sugar epimerase